MPLLLVLSGFPALILRPLCCDCIATPNHMTVKEIFDLRKQGRIEEAYEAIKARYANYRGHYTTLCMFWTASDVFKKRLAEGRTEEARKIFLALQRLVPFLSDRDGRVTAFMQYASSRLESAQRFSRCDVPSSAERFSRSGVPSCLSPLDGASASSARRRALRNICSRCISSA